MDNPKINEWLSLVEQEMRMTLAQNLASAVADIKQFKHGLIDTKSYLQWCDKYQAQLIVLAAQISWSEEVCHYALCHTVFQKYLQALTCIYILLPN